MGRSQVLTDERPAALPGSPDGSPVVVCPRCGAGYPAGTVACRECSEVYEAETEKARALLALAGALERRCTECGELILPGQPNDDWAHDICAQVVIADNEAVNVIDDGTKNIIRWLRRHGRCQHQYNYATYCGRDICDSGSDYPDRFCLEHDAEENGDYQESEEEHVAWTRWLLALHAEREVAERGKS